MTTPAENDARMQALYREKAARFDELLGMANGDLEVDRAAMRIALEKLHAADDELNALTEEMFFTVLTDLRR
jgi:hypothetical protein